MIRREPHEDIESKNEEAEVFSLPELVRIPRGGFLMGTSSEQIQKLLWQEEWAEEWYQRFMFASEQPQHEVQLETYLIGRFPVTNRQYHQFVWDVGYRTPRYWTGFSYAEDYEDHPVVGVSKVDAQAYCRWLAEQTGQPFRLPTEAEWEKASRGVDGRIYPWGGEFNPWRCNTQESGKRSTTPVDFYSPGGDSPFGVSDMAGNVWEWTASRMLPYPYQLQAGSDEVDPGQAYVVRGGAWYYSRALARCTSREGLVASYVSNSLGFRVACSST